MIRPPRPVLRVPRRRRARAAAVLLAAPAVALTLLVAPGQAASGSPSAATSAGAAPSTEGSDITIVQANLRSPQPYANFQEDASTIQAMAPDFITYNEVAFRADEFLAPEGYSLWRTPGQYTGASPVAWRTDDWTVEAKGTRQVSSYDKKPPGRQTLLGMRYASWVTLRSRTDDRVLSVVSMHAAPKVRGMPDLRRPAVRNLGKLVDELGPQGPVLVGGDFNFGARSASYPADLLEAAKLRSTFELLQSWFPTGDHGGYTIDFIFVRRSEELFPDVHFPVELNSDHDAVVAGLSWNTTAPSSTVEVRNVPEGEVEERRAVSTAVVDEIRSAEPGGVVQVSTRGMMLRHVHRALLASVEEGVRVRYVTRSPRLTDREEALSTALRSRRGSSFKVCTDDCAAAWKAGQAPSVVLVRDDAGTPTSTVSASRRLRDSLVALSSQAVVSTSSYHLGEAAAAFSRR